MHRPSFRIDPRTLLCALILAAGAGCARQQNDSAETATYDEAASAVATETLSPSPPAPPSATAKMSAEASEADVQQSGVDAGQLASAVNTMTDPQRRFVRIATASFQVDDVYRSALAIEDAVAAESGFVVENRITTQTLREMDRPAGEGKRLRLSEVQPQGSMVVRVPSDRTQSFLRVIAKQMAFLDARSFEARDVQFELLRQQLAYQRGQDVQRDIARAGEQPGKTDARVDAAVARGNVLAARDEALLAEREMEDRIAFSTLTLELQQPVQVREQVVPDTESILRARGPGFFSEVGDSVRAGWRGLLVTVIALFRLWPLWLVVIVVVLGVRALRRSRVRRAPSAPPAG